MGSDKSGRQTFRSERLVLFSDAVMAVAITLLVLDLKVPEGLQPAALNGALVDLTHAFWCYVLSFVVIGIVWMAHQSQFSRISRVDGVLMWINTLFLMGVVLIPFVTSVMSDDGGALSTMLYASVLMVCCLLLAGMWGYASHDRALMAEDVPAEVRRTGLLTPLLTALVFAVSIGIAYGVGSTAAQWSWVLAAFAGPVADRLSRA